MARVDRLLDHVLASREPMAFRDLERLLKGSAPRCAESPAVTTSSSILGCLGP
jgi:hypothetical protein